MNKILGICVSIAVLSTVLPLFSPGFIPTHDGEFHIVRFWQFEKMLRVGNLFPRWAPDLGSGYGIPLFNFHYPFPNYLGSLYHVFGASFPDAVKLVLATGYLLSIGFCFLWLSSMFARRVAIMGTAVFAYVPYWFVDLYVRGAVGEVLAIAWAMLALCAIERGRKRTVAVAIALIILSHNIMALVFLPILWVYVLIRKRLILLSFLPGVGIASYFWIPAILERPYVVGLNAVNFQDHFPTLVQLLLPSWGTGFSQPGSPADEMSFQIGFVSLFVLVAGIVFAIRKNLLALYFFLLCGAAFLLMQEGSIPIWQKIPVLSYVQYPWRLLAVFLPAIAYLTARIVKRIRYGFFGLLLASGAVIFGFSYARPVVYAPRSDEYYLSRPNFTDGTSSLGNSFSTRWSSWKEKRPAQKIDVVAGGAAIADLTSSPVELKFSVIAASESRIRVNTLYYPGWEVRVNGKAAVIDYEHDGTITFSVLPGQWNISVHFTETTLRKAADFISILSLFWLAGSFILESHAYRHRHHAAV